MKTVILPGYSPHNKDWAYEIAEKLDLEHEILVHEWKHWQKGKFNLKDELDRILKKIGKEKVNFVAKSVGTRVLMHLTPLLKGQQIEKVILCGIPTKGESKSVFKIYSQGLLFLRPEQVVVFQNRKDPFASHQIIKKFVHSINPQIPVFEKPRSDHDYPFVKDFQKFLTG